MLSLELFVTVRFLGVVVVQHSLSPDFEWVGDVPGFFDEEFARIFRQYTFRDSDHDEDLRSLPQFFLSGARPDFPDYVNEFVQQSRIFFRRLGLRRYLIRESCLWNPVSTLIAILALEGIIQISRMPTEHRLNVGLLEGFLHQYPYWRNDMNISAYQPAARLAIDTFRGGQMSWWLKQVVHQLRIFIPGTLLPQLR